MGGGGGAGYQWNCRSARGESGTERSMNRRERNKNAENAAVKMRCDVHGSEVRGILILIPSRKCDGQLDGGAGRTGMRTGAL